MHILSSEGKGARHFLDEGERTFENCWKRFQALFQMHKIPVMAKVFLNIRHPIAMRLDVIHARASASLSRNRVGSFSPRRSYVKRKCASTSCAQFASYNALFGLRLSTRSAIIARFIVQHVDLLPTAQWKDAYDRNSPVCFPKRPPFAGIYTRSRFHPRL